MARALNKLVRSCSTAREAGTASRGTILFARVRAKACSESDATRYSGSDRETSRRFYEDTGTWTTPRLLTRAGVCMGGGVRMKLVRWG